MRVTLAPEAASAITTRFLLPGGEDACQHAPQAAPCRGHGQIRTGGSAGIQPLCLGPGVAATAFDSVPACETEQRPGSSSG
ncbi:unnamed protein product [Gadus morhua 'NCC']